ncbi:RdRP-domain-containing protein [Dichomitus squalens]|uniref:RNA-dependent RNA polymerase n=1 Tax=Dichomitus squalens TaxID=114155 RepID=A0A4V2K5L1_9APHY|nr:RdRP-domain-containing protein [Dichomitus squalens]TBU48793.1 RdRP-domain-containing protein [Dichomitus squalens]TBU57843.1 RdRP-domain-containing protein [Dichomitus squalens]
MLQKVLVSISTAVCQDGVNISNKEQQSHPETRATRLVQDTTRFLLVSVNKKARDSTLRQTLARWIYEGIEHNGTVYRFLGYTESQVKAGKLMFFHEGEGWTVERMLESFGDLPGVYLKSGYGKYAARLGLSFSSTVQSLDIPLECAIEIPDLTAPDGSLHSDGCGMIRDSFAAQLCARHNLPPDTTVFQVRRGGIKGLLVRYPDNEFDVRCRTHSRTRGGHYMIAYRPSMFKYAGGPTCLELNNHNSPSASARLNVQFMALLLTLGVPFAIFQRLVLDQLDLIGSILTDREKALQYVKGELDAAAEDDFAQGLYAMLLARQELSEPYVRHKLQTFQRKQYITLRNKMSLRIPDAAYLFGVVDEAGVLAPNEVHVNLPNRSGVLVRDVIVGRNPSYHPGDFRKLRAVDHPSLRHHRNCIVFSSNAAHSIPDTIAGGDLDGDMYFVCWDPCLIPPREAPPFSRAQSATAAAQAGTAPASATRQLSNMPKAAIDTFMQLKFSRLLGMMAKEWTRQVELTPDLARSAYCQELVPLIESALDLMKSGEDFARLEKRFKQLQSRHAGHNLDDFKSPIQRLRDLIPEGEGEKLQNLSGRHDLSLILRDEDPTRWNRHLSEAVNVLPRFNKELSKAINLDSDYGQLRSICGIKPRTYTSHFPAESYASSADRDSKNRRADMVKQSYQSLYFGGGSKEQQCEQRMRASAWYYYGYTQDKPAFAWLGERYLNEIKACERTIPSS